ncbi:transcobalamin-1-like isoform X2 [Tamandua tetradactyla]|uniref:transcobalamin-1-like isoform X2 n=1 Tax=Tamandua tetradactyla TaxID=48850 RepID=UPI0040543517
MRQSHQLPLVGLLLIIPNQLCKICAQAANVLLSLRLTGMLSQSQEQQMIQRVKHNMERKGADLSSGQLALTILALGACHNPNESFVFDSDLVGLLGKKFQAEIENMEVHNGNPLTNYYQLSLDVLALCLFNGNYSITKIAKYFTPENKNYYFDDQFSVDTGGMAVLALTCVRRHMVKGQTKADQENSNLIDNYIESLVKKILSEKKENGLIGNIYSTGEAMQALFVSSNHYSESEWNCQQTRDTVLKEIPQGAFSVPIAAAQILPALLGKTYLDVNKDSPCVYDNNNISISVPGPAPSAESPSPITVHYSVRINKTYSTDVTVLNGSVFLDVMEEAQKQNQTIFGFTMEESSWGPYITSVQGLRANNNDRTYWQLLSDGRSLSQGAGSYIVHSCENLEIRWSKY